MDIELNKLLEKMKNENINLIDIRNNYNYQMGFIPTAKNIPSIELKLNPSKYLSKEKIYYLYCQTGHTSKLLSNDLNNQGYKTVNILGGYNNYLFRI